MNVRCVLVEDHLMFMQLITTMLRSVRGLTIMATATKVQDGIVACRQHQPDLLIIDLALPDGDGLGVARALVQKKPSARIIILSGQTTTFVCPPDLRDNISDVISKSGAFEEIELAVKQFMDEFRKKRMSNTERKFEEQKSRPLSKREHEIFSMIGAGMISKEIADNLGISIHTVHVFRKRIAEKLGLSGNEIVHEAIRQYQAALGRDQRDGHQG